MKRTIKLPQLKFILFLMIGAVTFYGCSDDDDNNTTGTDGEQTIVAAAQQNDDLSILADAIVDAGLQGALEADGPYTVFAPSDDAFENLPEGTLASLSSEQLAEILQFHVIEGAVASGDLQGSQDVETLLGEEILVQSVNGVIVNGDVSVTTADIEASNGIIHVIDQVLLPEGYRDPNLVDIAVDAGNFTTLLNALDMTELTTTFKYISEFTVLAPTDGAFANLPDGLLGSLTDAQLETILEYHVIAGETFSTDLTSEQAVGTLGGDEVFITTDSEGNVTVNGSSSVVAADLDATNGVVHALDQVLLPDAFGTVVDAASKRYFFETLVGAVVDAGLAGALSDTEASLTVFAPTDEAFANLPDGLLASLTTEQLAEILQYHVLPVNVASGDLEATQAPASLTGEAVYVTAAEGEVTVNGSSMVTTADVVTSNGTIHAVDQVILPNAYLNIVGIASKNYNLSTLVSLVADAGLVATLEGDGPFTVFAPTNAAFAEIEETLSSLTAEQVEEVLTYHIVAAEALAGSLNDGDTIPTVQGEDITVQIDAEGNVTLNNSVNVTTVDLQGTNGVIHVIDGVLLPPSYTN